MADFVRERPGWTPALDRSRGLRWGFGRSADYFRTSPNTSSGGGRFDRKEAGFLGNDALNDR
jgi:hypothetical protein